MIIAFILPHHPTHGVWLEYQHQPHIARSWLWSSSSSLSQSLSPHFCHRSSDQCINHCNPNDQVMGVVGAGIARGWVDTGSLKEGFNTIGHHCHHCHRSIQFIFDRWIVHIRLLWWTIPLNDNLQNRKSSIEIKFVTKLTRCEDDS